MCYTALVRSRWCATSPRVAACLPQCWSLLGKIVPSVTPCIHLTPVAAPRHALWISCEELGHTAHLICCAAVWVLPIQMSVPCQQQSVTVLRRCWRCVSAACLQLVRGARVAVCRRFLDFTAHQDLQLAAGVDVDWPKAAKTAVGSSSGSSSSSSKPKADLYLSVRENNWGVHYRRGMWSLTYDL
eukprot:GHRQ01021732.1.p1 GENE.GHRQ01021732.1~~GHRQ01021732.1.p1  ORF type:complete len:185 (+),score=47.82 GHRQ01021732.1:754-1308(+)